MFNPYIWEPDKMGDWLVDKWDKIQPVIEKHKEITKIEGPIDYRAVIIATYALDRMRVWDEKIKEIQSNIVAHGGTMTDDMMFAVYIAAVWEQKFTGQDLGEPVDPDATPDFPVDESPNERGDRLMTGIWGNPIVKHLKEATGKDNPPDTDYRTAVISVEALFESGLIEHSIKHEYKWFKRKINRKATRDQFNTIYLAGLIQTSYIDFDADNQ